MIKLKTKKRKNPLDFYKKLNDLVEDKNVFVRIKNPCINFQVIGKLYQSRFKNIYEVGYRDKKSKGLNILRFNQSDVSNIINNYVIEVTPYITEEIFDYTNSLKENDDKLKEFLKLKMVTVELNYPFAIGSAENSKIEGKLKYDRSKELYYIQNKDAESVVTFGIECVTGSSYFGEHISLDVSN